MTETQPTKQDANLAMLESRMRLLRLAWFIVFIFAAAFTAVAAPIVVLLLPQFAWGYSAVIAGCFAAGISILVMFTRVEYAAYVMGQRLRLAKTNGR